VKERVQKILARAGLASRRAAERWILEGRVSVNGVVVRELGVKADPVHDRIKVDQKLLGAPPAHRYILFHKPPGLITSLGDPRGRPHVGAYLEQAGIKERLFPVGRLDFNSSGLLLLTNDGELSARLTHPRYGIAKVYRVKISRRPSERELERLRRGVELDDGRSAPARVRVLEVLRRKAWVEVEICEGRYREVRRMFEALGYFVERLVRLRLGPLRLGSLPPGELRPLSPREVDALRRAAGM
jgi:23S rRNA pseudouridine2605 synthase